MAQGYWGEKDLTAERFRKNPLQLPDVPIEETVVYSGDFVKIDAPIFTPTCAEDSTELYEVEHTNGEKMFLSQT